MIGRCNSLSQKLAKQCPATYTVHCHAHHLDLASTDTLKELQHIHDCEHGLVQTRKYFTRSPLKTARLHEIQAADVDFRFIFVIIKYSPVLFNNFASGAADIGDQLVFRYSRPVFKLSGEINWID